MLGRKGRWVFLPRRLGCLLVLASADDLPSFFCAYLSPPFQVKAARRRVRFVDGLSGGGPFPRPGDFVFTSFPGVRVFLLTLRTS